MAIGIPTKMAVDKPSRRIAVLIGNGKYDDPALRNSEGPEKDVRSLARVLGNPKIGQFEVSTLIDQEYLKVRQKVASVAKECTENDLLLIYYGGLSFKNQEKLYLPVAGTEINLAYATALDCDFLLETFSRSKARQKVLILDGCYAGSFFRGNRGIPDGFMALTSCGANEECFETPDGGYFTQCLVKGLETNKADRDRDGRVSLDEAFEFIRDALSSSKLHNKSNPQRWIWNLPDPVFLTISARPAFVSYSRKDQAFVETLFKAIQAAGVPAWMDAEGIQGGDDWSSRIATALKSSRFVMAVISQEALDSKWVQRELDYADKYSIPILPIVIGNVIKFPDWFDLKFSSVQQFNCNPEQPESVIEVVDHLKNFYEQIGSPK